MRTLNLVQLRTFMEVVALGSFSAAARRLNLTQPAVSLHIRELEQRFGVQLIERMGKQAHATGPGRDLVEHAGRIFRESDDTESAMRRFRDGWLGRVHIGTTLTGLTYELPPILRKLRADYPGIDLLVTNMPTRDSVENILKNAIDLALVTLPVKGARLRITPLRPEMLVAIFPADTTGVPEVVTPSYVARQRLILDNMRGAVTVLVMQWLSKQMPLSNGPMHLGTVEAVKKGVASGLGMAIVPDVAVAEPTPDIIVRPLKPQLPCTLALIELRNKPNGRALEIVRKALLELRTGGEFAPFGPNGKPRRAASPSVRNVATRRVG
jgi:DNA-binding transcriptional LysR family regulator